MNGRGRGWGSAIGWLAWAALGTPMAWAVASILAPDPPGGGAVLARARLLASPTVGVSTGFAGVVWWDTKS